MQNFVFQNATKIIFGKGVENGVGGEAKKYTNKLLLHYGGGSVKKSGLYDRVKKSLEEAGVACVELAGVKPNPRLSLVREGIELCRKEGVGFILAVGGGSVIDSAKAIAAGVLAEGDIWDYFLEGRDVTKSLPLATILTIPAAGSEMSNSAVVTDEKAGLKRDIGGDCLRPVFSMMNPELTFTLPPYQTACGIVDMMAHIMERYFTNEKEVDLTDRLCEAALRSIIYNAPIVLKEPENYAARAEIMWAGTLAHNDLLGTGRIADWGSHLIEHELSGAYDVAHGAGLAVTFPAWMKYVMRHDLSRFVQFAVRVWDVDLAFAKPAEIAKEGVRRLERFFSSIGMPTRLPQLGIDDSRILEMAEKAMVGRSAVGKFVPLHMEDIAQIYHLAL